MSDQETTFSLRTSPTIGKLAEAMAKAQEEMSPAEKDAVNPHFKNRYASLASSFAALKPMHKNGIAVFQPPVPHGQDGVCVQTLLVHASGEWLAGELYMPASKKDPQGFGSALSYARRYCLQATTGQATDEATDDDGERATTAKQETKPEPAKSAPAATESVNVQALVDALIVAKDTDDLSAASLAVGRVASKMSEADRMRCRAAHDNKLRELEKVSK